MSLWKCYSFVIQCFALEGVSKLPLKDYHVAQLRHLLHMPKIVCTFKWKGQEAGLYKRCRPVHMCDLDVYLSTRLKFSTKKHQ